jgi:hypothetical protein
VTPNQQHLSIAVDGDTTVDGKLVAAPSLLPGILLVHG